MRRSSSIFLGALVLSFTLTVGTAQAYHTRFVR